ncbi:MAG: DEAD/DEAH box helicase [Planctomycetota bacterium]
MESSAAMQSAGSPSSSPAHTPLPADSPLTVLRGVGPRTAAALAAVGIATLRDLVLWFPRRHRDVAPLVDPPSAALGRRVRVAARVVLVERRRLRGGRTLVSAELTTVPASPPAVGEPTIRLRVAFFNQPWRLHTFEPGVTLTLEGTLRQDGVDFGLDQVEVVAAPQLRGERCTVAYRAIEGVAEGALRRVIALAIERIAVHDLLPPLPVGLGESALGDRRDLRALLVAMHRPTDVAEHESTRRWFALHEAVELFRRLERVRRARLQSIAPRAVAETDHDARLADILGFSPTSSQRAAMLDLRTRLSRSEPMGVLLLGDVGSGKTAVALDAALLAARAGCQVAFLAPTELLVEQHHQRHVDALTRGGVNVACLTGSMPSSQQRALRAAIAAGIVDLVFGTHALLATATEFARLGLAIVDEDHRFGVGQRQALSAKGRAPHLLVMSATPIPRTTALARFGDLDLLELRGRPQLRGPAHARFVARQRWPRVLRAIARAVRRGHGVFVVCPKIGENGEKGGVMRLHAELAPRFACAVVHGRMPAAERSQAARALAAGVIDVLIGTTVLEVGIDVPRAALMVVVAAEQFGLAALHQLRGRVGRGLRRGLCILTGDASPRIAAIVNSTDGFDLAEQDLALRGAGELCGLRQSGAIDFRALDPIDDHALLLRAREAVRSE